MFIFLQSKLTSIILVLALVWIGRSAISAYQQVQLVHEEEANLEAKIAVLELANAALQADINQNNDPEYLERQAKIQLNYRPADERVAFVYRTAATTPASKSFDAPTVGVAKYWSWFKKLFR